MTTQHASDFESPELARILKTAEHDAVTPDLQVLAAIREKTRDAFRAAQSSAKTDVTSDAAGRGTGRPFQKPASGSRWMALLSMAASLMFAIWLLSPNVVQADPTLGDLLKAVRDASALSVVVQTPEGSSTVSFQAPGIVRWDDANGDYRIADGSRLWKVDSSNAVIGEEASPLPAEGLDGLTLLQLADLSPDRFRKTGPVRRDVVDGVPSLIYEAHVTLKEKAATLRAIASEDSKQLTSLQLVSDENAGVLADVRLVAMNAAVRKDAFTLPRSLQQTGSIGTISELQGLVYVRSFPGHRWTPASESLSLFPGDQIRCETRGANAAVVRLTSGSQVTLGPSAVVSLTSASRIQLLQGEAEAKSSAPAGEVSTAVTQGLEVAFADGSKRTVTEPVLLSVSSEPSAVRVLDVEPAWLKSLRGSLTAESLGSLVAQVDGRDVSLTMGFHHVTVEVRDQIARTTIEESFVNNTNTRLEGQFHFPLPHDASISGFGMWIGNELVEADVVEKQRAREIYETILRENRDPGLLEWEGGNIFKARVFPIEAHSEKRIRITYTQTLPLQNGVYRYHYPLRSELLQKTPLKHLSIDVLIHSKVPLASLACPSHSTVADAANGHATNGQAANGPTTTAGIRQLGPVTIEQTRFSGRLHYEASDITPQRDFEMLCAVDGRQSDVVFVPHVRGSDGYFVLQLSPPAVGDGNWSRMMVRDGKPLDVVVVCDTSRSMDKFARRQQHELVAALLGSLAESDRVRVACVDTDCDWILKDALPVTEEVRTKIVKRLEDRRSLGWSNLGVGFEEIFKATSPDTQVVYIGDGTVVAQDSQAGASFASWLNRVAKIQKVPACHAIAVGNAYDMTVLRAIGRTGRGTTRIASTSAAPGDVIRELLFEVTRPGLRDLKVEFRGLEVAAVYPAELPNLPDGMQHILTGRFRPSSGAVNGEVIITGLRGDEPVKYVARVSAKPEEAAQQTSDAQSAGNEAQSEKSMDSSFIPRLWAKQHIDHLLQEAATPEIQQRIIALSQEFHLMTPYTSLLVLETDEDRRRFGVDRSIQMRDGEQFFAEGRKEAEYSLRQQQLQIAKLWRQQLHKVIQQQIDRYGRDEFLAPQVVATPDFSFYVSVNRGGTTGGMPGAPVFHKFYSRSDAYDRSGAEVRGEKSGQGDPRLWFDSNNIDVDNDNDGLQNEFWAYQEATDFIVEERLRDRSDTIHRWSALGREPSRSLSFALPPEPSIESLTLASELPAVEFATGRYDDDVELRLGQSQFGTEELGRKLGRSMRHRAKFAPAENYFGLNVTNGDDYAEGLGYENSRGYRFRGVNPVQAPPPILVEPPVFGLTDVLPAVPAPVSNETTLPDALRDLFPNPIHRQSRYTPDAQYWEKCEWPQEVRSILQGLENDDAEFQDGVELTFERTDQHPTRGTRTTQAATHLIWHPATGWILDIAGDQGLFRHWSVGEHSGSIRTATRTGMVGKLSRPIERCSIPMSFRDQIAVRIASQWSAEIESTNDEQVVILLTFRERAWEQMRWTIDRERKCLLKTEWLLGGTVLRRTTFSEHAQIGSQWRAGRIVDEEHEELSGALRTVGETRLAIKVLPGEEAKGLIEKLSANLIEGFSDNSGTGNSRTLLLPVSFPGLQESRQAVQANHATAQQKFVRLVELAYLAQWDDSLSLLETTLKETQQTEAGRFVRAALLQFARRFEVLRKDVEQTTSVGLLTSANDVLKAEAAPSPATQEFLLSPFPQWALHWSFIARLRELSTQTMDARQLESALARLVTETEAFQAGNPAVTDNTALLELLLQKRGLLETHHRTSEVEALQQTIRTLWPWNMDELLRQVQLLQAKRRTDDVRALYEAQLAADKAWTRAELDTLFGSFLGWLRRRGEFEAGLKLCDRWTERCPMSSSAWQHRLRSLIELNQPEVVMADVERWLTEGRLPQAPDDAASLNQTLDPKMMARRDAAISFGLGSVAGLQLRGPQKATYDSLVALAATYARSERHLEVAKQILDNAVIAIKPAGRDVVKTYVRWLTETAATAKPAHLNAAMTWLQQSGLHDCPERQELMVALRKHLHADLATMAHERAQLILIELHVCDDTRTTKEDRQAWLDVLIRRWKEAPQTDRAELSSLVQQVINSGFDQARNLEWHRQQFVEARDSERPGAASRLFETLVSQAWTREMEEETWTLLSIINPVEPKEEQACTAALVPGLNRWVETMVSKRAAHHQTEYPGFNDLDSKRQQHVTKECRVKAIREMVAVLNEKQQKANVAAAPAGENAAPDLAGSLPASIFRFVLLHRLMLQCELIGYEVAFGVSDEERSQLQNLVLEDCQKLCGPEPKPSPDPSVKPANDEDGWKQRFDLIERHTAFAMWMLMAIQLDRPAGTAASVQESVPEDKALPAQCQVLLNYVRRGQEIDPVAPDVWRAAEFGLLIAFDRPKLLEERLRLWFTAEETRRGEKTAAGSSRRNLADLWRIQLGRVLAELDRLEEAVALYESAGTRDELSAQEWQQLSVWQHALDRRQDMQNSIRRSWKHQTPEELMSDLNQALQAWQNSPETRTPQSSEDVRLRLEILLQGTSNLDSAVRLLAQWYKATHDPLVMDSFAPFVTGRSRALLFDVLEYTQSAINDVDQEAGSDALLRSIETERLRILAKPETRDGDKAQKRLDLMGLRVLELQASAAATRVTNQPQPHERAVIAALKELEQFDWSDTERQRIALRYHNLTLKSKVVASARWDAMERLMLQEKPGTPGRLSIAILMARLVERSEPEKAGTLVDTEIRSALNAGDKESAELLAMIDFQIQHLIRQKRFVAAETLLMETTREVFLNDRAGLLFQIQLEALTQNGRVSAGEGTALYEALQEQYLAKVLDPELGDELSTFISRYFHILEAGRVRRFEQAAEDARVFTTTHAEPLMLRRIELEDQLISECISILRRTGQTKQEIEFLLRQLEAEPLALQWTRPTARWMNWFDDLISAAFDRIAVVNARALLVRKPEAGVYQERLEAVMTRGLESVLALAMEEEQGVSVDA
ncbi:MAG: hypothetical protein JNM43_27030, partial [Planctomycetaceae bacterium]|nr:hypothetical protein [Planctomycetaceae bacterium]